MPWRCPYLVVVRFPECLRARHTRTTCADGFYASRPPRNRSLGPFNTSNMPLLSLRAMQDWRMLITSLGGPVGSLLPARAAAACKAAAQKAIELDRDLPDGYAVRAMCRLWLDWDPAAAEQDIRHAVTLNPSFALAHQYFSTVLVVRGDMEAALAEARRAAELDPLAPG